MMSLRLIPGFSHRMKYVFSSERHPMSLRAGAVGGGIHQMTSWMMGLRLNAGLQSSDDELDAHRTTSRHPMNFAGWGRWWWNSSDDFMDDGFAPESGLQSSDDELAAHRT